MDLNNIQKINKAFKAQTVISAIFVVGLVVAFLVNTFVLSQKIDDLYSKVIVIDTDGNAYASTPVDAGYMRVFEYENHVKTFTQLWYAFDENNYEENIKSGLELIGDKGKELYNEYNQQGMFASLRSKNLRYNVFIKDIKVDMTSVPKSGTMKATQTGYRGNKSVSRDMNVTFSLYDVARSKENIHGVKIDQWNVKYTNAYGENDEHEAE